MRFFSFVLNPNRKLMRPLLALLLCCTLVLHSCQFWEASQEVKRASFSDDLSVLKAYFHMPGLAAMVLQEGEVIYEDYFGKANLDTGTPVSPETLFPVASVTKVFSAVLVLQLAQQGKLSLEDPVSQYLENQSIPDSVRIKHLLSHTSEGRVGEQFHYSNRFGLLTAIIEKSTARPFREVMETQILDTLRMNNTFLFENEKEMRNANLPIAKGYQYDRVQKDCEPETGYSASAGLVTNLHDLAKFTRSLRRDTLLSRPSRDKMITPLKRGLPYGLGIFVQEVQGVEVHWAYGQFDCYSSLYVSIPSKDLTLLMAANNNLISDPARLIYGDITSSLFAVSFLKNYVFNKQEIPILETERSLQGLRPGGELFRQKLLSQALAASYLARFDTVMYRQSAELLDKVLTNYSDTAEYASLNLMHNILFLKDVAAHYELPPLSRFDPVVESAGNTLLQTRPNDPYLHLYLASYYDGTGNIQKAREHYTWLNNAPNFSANWYKKDAEKWLSQHPRE